MYIISYSIYIFVYRVWYMYVYRVCVLYIHTPLCVYMCMCTCYVYRERLLHYAFLVPLRYLI